MKTLITLALSFIKRYAIIFAPGKRVGLRGLLPLVGVLPVVVYAYAVQAIVVARTEAREQEMTMRDVKNLARRIDKTRNADVANCRDYCHWDDIYHQMLIRDPEWMETNIEAGIATSAFGFDIILLQGTKGEPVWSKGLHARIMKDLSRYRLLERSLSGNASRGFIVLDGRVYSFASDCVRLSNHTGKPRGMLLVARQVTAEYLQDLAVGTQDRLAFCQANSQVIAVRSLGQLSTLPPVVSRLMKGGKAPSTPMVEVSTDSLTAYGILPIEDINGAPAGSIINVTSRASVMSTLRTIRHFSIFLMILCGVIGVAGVSYSKNRALALRANRDELTGLYNHGYMQEQLKHHTQLAERYSRPLAVMLVDIDHFKYVNDTHGHTTGDLVLKSVAQLIVETVRGTDIAARYGGEEFVVLLPETDLVQALSGAERLRATIQKTTVRTKCTDRSSGPHGISLTVSVGVGVYPDDGMTPSDLLQAADAALLEAKRDRNTVCAFQEVVKTHGVAMNRLPVLDAFLRDSSMSAIRPLVAAIDTRDPGSVRHSEKTAEYAVAIGRELGFSTQDLALTCKAALLHDVGMIGVDQDLLMKTGSLEPEEIETIKRHCKAGAEILAQSPQLVAVADIVLRHHERFDGQGYPGRLAGNDIPMISRVVAIADSIDAMVSPRSYKEALTLEQALEEIRKMSGAQFDPFAVQAAGRVISRVIEQQTRDREAA